MCWLWLIRWRWKPCPMESIPWSPTKGASSGALLDTLGGWWRTRTDPDRQQTCMHRLGTWLLPVSASSCHRRHRWEPTRRTVSRMPQTGSKPLWQLWRFEPRPKCCLGSDSSATILHSSSWLVHEGPFHGWRLGSQCDCSSKWSGSSAARSWIRISYQRTCGCRRSGSDNRRYRTSGSPLETKKSKICIIIIYCLFHW